MKSSTECIVGLLRGAPSLFRSRKFVIVSVISKTSVAFLCEWNESLGLPVLIPVAQERSPLIYVRYYYDSISAFHPSLSGTRACKQAPGVFFAGYVYTPSFTSMSLMQFALLLEASLKNLYVPLICPQRAVSGFIEIDKNGDGAPSGGFKGKQ